MGLAKRIAGYTSNTIQLWVTKNGRPFHHVRLGIQKRRNGKTRMACTPKDIRRGEKLGAKTLRFKVS